MVDRLVGMSNIFSGFERMILKVWVKFEIIVLVLFNLFMLGLI